MLHRWGARPSLLQIVVSARHPTKQKLPEITAEWLIGPTLPAKNLALLRWSRGGGFKKAVRQSIGREIHGQPNSRRLCLRVWSWFPWCLCICIPIPPFGRRVVHRFDLRLRAWPLARGNVGPGKTIYALGVRTFCDSNKRTVQLQKQCSTS